MSRNAHSTDKQKRKELAEQYKNRHPDMGIVCWQCGDDMWVDMSTNAETDYNGTRFQLELGSWPNKALQKAYKENPDGCRFSLVKKLEYDDYADDRTDDLKLLLMEFLDEHPEAKPMRVRFKL